MISFDNFDLTYLIPQSLKNHKDVKILVEIFNEEIAEFYEKKEQLFIFNLELQSDAVLDELAYQEHIDYYEVDFTREQKINLIKTAFKTHLTKGTRYAVETSLHAVLDDFFIREWFEYDGDPGTFLLLGKTIPNSERLYKAEKITNSYKRASAHLDPFFGLLHGSEIQIKTDVKENDSTLDACGTLKTDYVTYQSTLGKRYQNIINSEVNNNTTEFIKASTDKFTKNTKGIKHSYIGEFEINKYRSEFKISSENIETKCDYGIKETETETVFNNIFAYNCDILKSCSKTLSVSEV